MDKVLDLLCDPKNPVSVKVAGLHAIKNVAEAMHQDRMQQSFAPLQRREEVVRKVCLLSEGFAFFSLHALVCVCVRLCG